MTPALRALLEQALRTPVAESVARIIALTTEELDAERLAPRMAKINRWSLRRLEADDVFVFGANAANNVIDFYESRFTERALREIARLAPGSPMAQGHDIAGRVYATIFDADVLENADGARVRELRDISKASWVRELFYMAKRLSWASDMNESIMAGHQREVSLHWTFTTAVCSICEKDIRRCEHFPGEEYEGKKCFYEMSGVREVLETSFVVRGGQKNTSIWQPGEEQPQRVLSFGEAIREAKSSNRVWAELRDAMRKRNGDPSENRLADFIGRGLRRSSNGR